MLSSRQLRSAGINTELFPGEAKLEKQVRHADRMGIPLVVFAGDKEFARDAYGVKDLRLGSALSSGVASRSEWVHHRPGQETVGSGALVSVLRGMLARTVLPVPEARP